MWKFRPSEVVLLVYFTYAAGLAAGLPIPLSTAVTTIALNAVALAGLVLLAWADSLRRRSPLGILRDWYPLPLLLLAYREMGWFARPRTSTALEDAWVVWDRLLLNEWGLRALIECLGPVLPTVLEVAYALVYAIAPFSLAVLYLYDRRGQVDEFLFCVLVGVLSAEGLFPYFPSEPPRTVFPGQDLPAAESLFRQFNHWYLGHWGIHLSVFPSAHVSGAFSAGFALMRLLPDRPWGGRFLVVLAVLIATATVYGRYHYAVDAVAGFGLSLVALVLTRCVYGPRPA